MKIKKTLTSIILTTILATGSVMAWVNIGDVNTSDSLTASIWNNLVAKINGNGQDIETLSGTMLSTEVFTSYLSNSTDFTGGSATTLINIKYGTVAQNSDSNIFEMGVDGVLTIKKPGIVSINANYDVIYSGNYSLMYILINGSIKTKTLSSEGSAKYHEVQGNLHWKVNANDQISFQSQASSIDAMDNGEWSTLTVQWTGIK